MGNFYTNITLRGAAHERLVELLRAWGETAYVSPAINGSIVVFPASTEMQDTDLLQALAARLSSEANSPALAVLNHDDDVLDCWLFTQGHLVDTYDSTPGYFGDFDLDDEDFDLDDEDEAAPAPVGGDAAVWCAAFGVSQAAEALEEVLRKRQDWEQSEGYLFASDRHADLVDALGLPDWAVGFGYNTLATGETPDGLDPDVLTHVSGE